MNNEMDDNTKAILTRINQAFGNNSSNQERQEAAMYLHDVGEKDPRFLMAIENFFKAQLGPQISIFFSNIALKTITKFYGSLEKEYLFKFQQIIVSFLRNTNSGHKAVINCVARLPCRIAKLGWLTDDTFKKFSETIATFLSGDMRTCNKGLLILSVFIDEINSSDRTVITAKQRKIASDFRDKELLNIFTLSIAVLRRIQDDNSYASSEGDNSFAENALDLTQRCLTFDFIGTIIDESTMEFGSLQVPSKWADVLISKKSDDSLALNITWKLLFGIINSNANDSDKTKCVCKCLTLLHSFSLVRRSLFSKESQKKNYYSVIVEGSLTVLRQYSGILNELSVFNSFCRLLISVKNNCQINTLMRLPGYEAWINAVAEFTITAFGLHGASSNGTHYLLQLWAKFSTSLNYLRSKTPNFLNSFIPQIAVEFMESNLKHLCEQMKEGTEYDSLLSDVEMSSICMFLPTLFLFDYQKSVTWVQTKFSRHMEYLKNFVHAQKKLESAEQNNALRVIEVEVAWAVYIAGTVISGNIPIGISKDKYKNLDAQICSMVFELFPYTSYRYQLQAREGAEATPLLERAILQFLHSFQKSYIQLYISQPVHCNQANNFFAILSASGSEKITSDLLMNSILEKLLQDLCLWNKNEQIVASSLKNLNSICQGYESYRQASNSPIVKECIANRFASFSSFLDHPANEKRRGTFFFVFARFAWNQKEAESSGKSVFETFLQPFDNLLTAMTSQSDLNIPAVSKSIVGLSRDLTGVCRACTKKNQYLEFFEWFDNHFNTFLVLFEVHSHNPSAAVPMLRFLEELVYNRNARIAYDSTSIEGLNLFRWAQKILTMYCVRLQQVRGETQSANDLYDTKIKGVSIAMSIMTKILSGSYVPFGAFEYYNDSSLFDVINAITGLVFSEPLGTVYSYHKMSEKYYELADILFLHHVRLACRLGSELFNSILQTLRDGVESTRLSHSNKAGSSIDYLFTYLVRTQKKKKKPEFFEAVVKNLETQKNLLMNMAFGMFSLVVFESVSNQFTLTRALHALLSFYPKMLDYYASILVKAQPVEHRDQLGRHMKTLVDLANAADLSGSARDMFSRSVIALRLHAAKVSVVPVY